MIYQLHHQPKEFSKSKETIFIAQSDDVDSQLKSCAWIADVQSRHILPDSHVWMLCNEKSEHFLCTYNEESVSV